MTHIAKDNASRAKRGSALHKFSRMLARIAAVVEPGRHPLHKVEAAHTARCERATYAAEEFQDTGIDPSDATGIASWQPDLPFFMQGGCCHAADTCV